MVKWADYLIVAKRESGDGKHIAKVKVIADLDDGLGGTGEFTRQQVVDFIKEHVEFITSTKNAEGKYTKGAKVDIIKVNGKEFLRTDRNSIASDNLGNLPDF